MLRVGDNHVLVCDPGAVSPFPWVVAVRELLLDWHTAAQRCCCRGEHFHWQSACGRDLGSAAATCISWAVLWAPRQLLPLQLRPVFVMAPRQGGSSACCSSLVDPVGSVAVVPDTSFLEQTLEHDQLTFAECLVPVVLSRRRVLLRMTASCPWSGNVSGTFARPSCRHHQLASVGCSVAFVARPALGAGHGGIGAY